MLIEYRHHQAGGRDLNRVRLTGFSIPVGGVDWEYIEGDKQVVRRVLTFMEDRRVLFEHHSREDCEPCRLSTEAIREYLTIEIPNAQHGGPVERSLRRMRDAARTFARAAGMYSTNFVNDDGYFQARLRASPMTEAAASARYSPRRVWTTRRAECYRDTGTVVTLCTAVPCCPGAGWQRIAP